METLIFTVKGVDSLLLNNPCTVDPFHPLTRKMKDITNIKKKTDADIQRLRDLEVEAKTYFDEPHGVYIPTIWIVASIAGVAFNKAKISKADIRSAVFPTEQRLKLNYTGMGKVKTIKDVVKNPEFVTLLLLKQGKVKVPKAAPIFNGWSFTATIEFDPTIINRKTLKDLLVFASLYRGWGDFRPTYGRATVEF